MSELEFPSDAQIVAELNDLLQLDHDAVQAYTLAIKGVEDPLHQDTLRTFRADHERHIRDLAPLIRARGGTPIEMPHVPSGAFKLAVQAAGNAGGEREVLMAFKANERQVRDKYVRFAEETLPHDVAEVMTRNAADEVKHYAWASEAMEALGAGKETLVGKAEGAFETVHARTADAIEGAERKAMSSVERARRSPATAIALGFVSLLLLRKALR